MADRELEQRPPTAVYGLMGYVSQLAALLVPDDLKVLW